MQKRICQFCFHFLAAAQCAVHIIWPKFSSGGFIILWTGLTLMTWFWNLCLQEPETERCDYYEIDLAEMLVGQFSGQADNIWQYFGLGWAMLWARSGSSGQHFGKGCRAAQLWSTGELLLPGKLRWSICWKVQWLFQNAALIKTPKTLPRIGKVCKTHWRSLSLNPSIINIAVAWCLKFFFTNFVISRNLQIFLRGRDWTEIGVNCL